MFEHIYYKSHVLQFLQNFSGWLSSLGRFIYSNKTCLTLLRNCSKRKYTYSLSCTEWDEMTDNALTSVNIHHDVVFWVQDSFSAKRSNFLAKNQSSTCLSLNIFWQLHLCTNWTATTQTTCWLESLRGDFRWIFDNFQQKSLHSAGKGVGVIFSTMERKWISLKDFVLMLLITFSQTNFDFYSFFTAFYWVKELL